MEYYRITAPPFYYTPRVYLTLYIAYIIHLYGEPTFYITRFCTQRVLYTPRILYNANTPVISRPSPQDR